MASSLEIERAEQRRWRLRPRWSGVAWFDRQVESEFLSPDEHRAKQAEALGAVLRFAARSVPYYRRLFRSLGLTASGLRGVEDLSALPVLTRAEVQEHGKALEATRLPRGHEVRDVRRTSGSTGQPVEVPFTLAGALLFGVLRQREMRWFRFDPGGLLAAIRPARDLPRKPDGGMFEAGETCRLPYWPLVGGYFETGPFIAFRHSNPLESQVEWLTRHRPDYLLAQAAGLEHLALGFQGRPRWEGLKAVQAISQQLTPEMRRRVETVFGVPVHENYGLNEFGLVASRCPEGGRFHVHPEQCLVEIVDDEGRPCNARERGRVLVTTLVNLAKPLIRYDTDDLAEAVEGPCPCGRTLPSFGAIHGRYRRIALLPPGTWDYWVAVQRALADMPAELARPLRQYQLHQYRSGAFELRLVLADALAAGFVERLRRGWEAAGGPDPAPLAILEVDEIPRPPGDKFQDFTSDFAPPPDAGAGDSPNRGDETGHPSG